MTHPLFTLTALLVLCMVSFRGAAAGPCDGTKGEAYGLCLAAESIPCNTENMEDDACQALAEEFFKLTESEPPWLNFVELICPCRREIDLVFTGMEKNALSLDGKCLIGQLTENVPVPDSIGIQVSGQLVETPGTVLMGAYTYSDTDPAGGQCEVEAAFEPLGEVYIALIINEAEQQMCADAIRELVLNIDMDCLEP